MNVRPIVAATSLILAACTTAASALIVDTATGCAVHNPNPRTGEAITWSGGCRDGLAHGHGIVEWFLDGAANGRYEGQLENGLIEGKGTAWYPSGSRYSGTFRNGLPEGHGTFHFPDGRRLTIEWHDGKPDGAGVLITSGGEIVHQTWKAGVRVN
jgi:hypothetical protein